MSDNEKMLLFLLKQFSDDRNQQAIFLQNYIAEFGPLSEECAAKVRELLQ